MADPVRVPRGTYFRAACELTAEDGEFDSYTLADRVSAKLDGYVSYRSAARWIRRHSRSGPVTFLRGPVRARVVDGGRPSAYAIVQIALDREMRRG